MKEIRDYLEKRVKMAGKALIYWEDRQEKDRYNPYLQGKYHNMKGRYEALADAEIVITRMVDHETK